MRRPDICLLTSSLLLVSCMPARNPTPSTRSGWETASPSSVGLDGDLLQRLSDDIARGVVGNVHAVVVARHGRLAYEAYFTGRDEIWFQGYGQVAYGPTVKHGLRSVSKSFAATVFGIALDRGFIDSVDMPLGEALPQYAALLTGEKADLTLRHVLTMSAGLRWAEGRKVANDADDDQYDLQEAEDPIELVLTRESVAPPGTKFNYSGGLTQVLAAVVEQSTGRPFLEFADSALFGPLAIEDWEWFSLGNARPAAWAGLRLTARDMAKLGQVYLDDGRWRGRSIVSRDWIDAALAPHIEAPKPRAPTRVTFSGYGFQWWYDTLEWHGRSITLHSAVGNGAQRIIVIPELDLVVAMFAGLYEDPAQGRVVETIVREYILPAVGETPRPPERRTR
jgi:CubicO group peptidase (beta-lactamase class C family)